MGYFLKEEIRHENHQEHHENSNWNYNLGYDSYNSSREFGLGGKEKMHRLWIRLHTHATWLPFYLPVSRDIYGICPLKEAITSDIKIGIVKALVNAKADINNAKIGLRGYGSKTPIVCAIERRCDNIRDFLAKAGGIID